MNDRNSFWNESTGERLIGCLGGSIGILSLLCVVSVIVHHCNRPVPTTTAAPWLNDDLSRPVTDIKELDYNRRLIIYRDEEPRRQLQKFEYPKDERIYGESQNLYEDYYEEIYEYFRLVKQPAALELAEEYPLYSMVLNHLSQVK